MSVDEILKKNKKKITSSKISQKMSIPAFSKFKIFFSNLFDARSRSVDFICLILLLNTFYKEMVILKYIFILLLLGKLFCF